MAKECCERKSKSPAKGRKGRKAKKARAPQAANLFSKATYKVSVNPSTP